MVGWGSFKGKYSPTIPRLSCPVTGYTPSETGELPPVTGYTPSVPG